MSTAFAQNALGVFSAIRKDCSCQAMTVAIDQAQSSYQLCIDRPNSRSNDCLCHSLADLPAGLKTHMPNSVLSKVLDSCNIVGRKLLVLPQTDLALNGLFDDLGLHKRDLDFLTGDHDMDFILDETAVVNGDDGLSIDKDPEPVEMSDDGFHDNHSSEDNTENDDNDNNDNKNVQNNDFIDFDEEEFIPPYPDSIASEINYDVIQIAENDEPTEPMTDENYVTSEREDYGNDESTEYSSNDDINDDIKDEDMIDEVDLENNSEKLGDELTDEDVESNTDEIDDEVDDNFPEIENLQFEDEFFDESPTSDAIDSDEYINEFDDSEYVNDFDDSEYISGLDDSEYINGLDDSDEYIDRLEESDEYINRLDESDDHMEEDDSESHDTDDDSEDNFTASSRNTYREWLNTWNRPGRKLHRPWMNEVAYPYRWRSIGLVPQQRGMWGHNTRYPHDRIAKTFDNDDNDDNDTDDTDDTRDDTSDDNEIPNNAEILSDTKRIPDRKIRYHAPWWPTYGDYYYNWLNRPQYFWPPVPRSKKTQDLIKTVTIEREIEKHHEPVTITESTVMTNPVTEQVIVTSTEIMTSTVSITATPSPMLTDLKAWPLAAQSVTVTVPCLADVANESTELRRSKLVVALMMMMTVTIMGMV